MNVHLKTNEYVKYVTQQIVTYVDTPTEKKKQTKQEKKDTRLPFMYRMFGLLPLALAVSIKKNEKKRKGNDLD